MSHRSPSFDFRRNAENAYKTSSRVSPKLFIVRQLIGGQKQRIVSGSKAAAHAKSFNDRAESSRPGPGTRGPLPGCAERVQDQPFFDGEFFGMENDLVGIADSGISGNAPGFVTNDAGTIAGVGFAIVVAVKHTRTIDQHG